MIALALHITAFFEQRLPIELHASECTRDSYAYAFQLLLAFASKRLNMAPSQLALEQIDAPLVLEFLNDLETTRRNGPSSRNARLAAVKSFMHFVGISCSVGHRADTARPSDSRQESGITFGQTSNA
jgi:integrase/recombinase XerD